MANTLVAVVGGIIVALIIVGTVFLQYTASLTVPPESLVRKWRNETRIPGND